MTDRPILTDNPASVVDNRLACHDGDTNSSMKSNITTAVSPMLPSPETTNMVTDCESCLPLREDDQKPSRVKPTERKSQPEVRDDQQPPLCAATERKVQQVEELIQKPLLCAATERKVQQVVELIQKPLLCAATERKVQHEDELNQKPLLCAATDRKAQLKEIKVQKPLQPAAITLRSEPEKDSGEVVPGPILSLSKMGRPQPPPVKRRVSFR